MAENGTVQDAACKQPEDALRRSEEHLHMVQQRAHVGIWERDVRTNTVTWTPELEALYGLEPGTVKTYADFSRHVHPDDLADLEAKRNTAIRDHQSFEMEFRIIRPSGDIRWIRCDGAAFYDKDGHPLRVLGTNIDVTQQKTAEEKLTWLASFPAKNPHPIVEIDLGNDAVSYVNAAAHRLFPDLVHRGITHPWLSSVREIAQRLHTEDGPLVCEIHVENACYHQTLLLTPDHQHLRVYGYNITERKQAEQALARLNVELETRVQQRTCELTAEIAERKRAEQTLHASEERLDRIVETTPGGIMILDTAGSITFANAAAEQILGLPRAAIIGRRYDDPRWKIAALDGHPMPSANLPFAQALRTGRPLFGMEHAIERPNGKRVILSINLAPLQDPERQLTGVVASFSDITKRYTIERELRRSEEHYRAVVEDQTELISRHNMDGTLTFANEVYCRFFGKTEQELLGNKWHPQAMAEDVPLIEAQLNTMSPTHPVAVIENRVYSANGQIRWMQFVNRGFFDSAGHLLETQAVGRDITERKQVEEALAAANKRLQDTLSNIAQGYYALDRNWRVVAVNDVAEKHFGQPAAQVIGMTFEQATQNRIPDNVRQGIREVMASGQPQHFDVESKVRPGTWAVDYIYPRDGGVEVYFTDITDRKRVEAALLKSEAGARAQAAELQALLASTPAITFIAHDATCRRMSSSDAALRLLRLPPGANTSKSAPPGERPETFRVFKNGRELATEEMPMQWVAATGKSLRDYELTLIFTDGTSRDIVGDIVPLIGPDGSVRGAVGAFIEITERKRIEETLRVTRERMHFLLEKSPAVIYAASPTPPYRATFISGNVITQLGYEPREFLEDPDFWQTHVHPEDAPRVIRDLSALLTQGHYCHEYRFQHRDGSYRWMHDELRLAQGADGKSQEVVGYWIDITERRRMEETLRDLSGRLLRLQDEERRCIARELHDTTAQQMAAVCLGLSSLEPQLKSLKPKARRQFADSATIANQCLAEIRTMSYLLHPPLLEELGLEGAMRDYTNGFAHRSGIHVDIELPSKPCPLSEEAKLTLFRILQEGLGNIHRHSGSRTACIRLHQTALEICLEVRDAGRGSTALTSTTADGNADHLGVGITGMRERLRQLGGKLEIDSNQGGTTIRARLPKPDPQQP